MTACFAANFRFTPSLRRILLSPRPFLSGYNRHPRVGPHFSQFQKPNPSIPSISNNGGRVVSSPFLQLLRHNIPDPTMTSQLEQLVQKVEGLSLDAFAEKYPNCHPKINPFDLYRAHLSSVLAEITGVDTKIIYPALAWTASLDKGDLVLPAPALRIKGKKPDELAAEWGAKVASYIGAPTLQSQWLSPANLFSLVYFSFPRMMLSSRSPRFLATS